jgi:hypothetical protein
MQSHYEARFAREMGCTGSELQAWLPGASRHAPIDWEPDGARVKLGTGVLRMQWEALPPRRIALVTLPRLSVQFDFGSADAAERTAFMKHFDLYTQRGGG